MHSHHRLHLKTFIMILIMVIAGPFGNVLLGKGMKTVGKITPGSLAQIGPLFLRVFTNADIWLGIALLITFFVAYMLVLSWADYSYVQPASSMAYGVVALFGMLLLGETISPLRWAGIAVICLGVLVVGYTNPRTTENR